MESGVTLRILVAMTSTMTISDRDANADGIREDLIVPSTAQRTHMAASVLIMAPVTSMVYASVVMESRVPSANTAF